ncbi:MAG TPA: hypothetical protein VHU77_12095, partial [Candidatus Limnocylindria bacterium]|nr:hypothetical protein [Candidatus Limnocylindria bacterium]
RYLIRSVANVIVEVDGGTATPFFGDFEYYAAKRGLDVEARGAVEGRATPRGIQRPEPQPRESAAAAAARKRTQAEKRNARYRRTRDLRANLARVEAQSREADAELAELSERLADPTTYADPARVRNLIERHNAARDRSDRLAADWARMGAELEALEAEPAVADSRS